MKNSQIKISIDELLKGITYKCKSPIRESIIRGISIDSRNVTKDYLFFAVNGFSQNGNSFIDDALKNGGTYPSILNIANDFAVDLFLKEKISFLKIPELIDACLQVHNSIKDPTLDDIYEQIEWVQNFITKITLTT